MINPNERKGVLPHTTPEDSANNDNDENHIPIVSLEPDEDIIWNRDNAHYNIPTPNQRDTKHNRYST